MLAAGSGVCCGDCSVQDTLYRMLCENSWADHHEVRMQIVFIGSFRPEGGAKPAVTENLGEQMQGDLIEFLASTMSGKTFLKTPCFSMCGVEGSGLLA